MPAILNIAANLGLGAAAMLILRRSQGARQELGSWGLWLLLAFEAVLFTPVASLTFRLYPHWSMLYWVDPQILPALEGWIGGLSAIAVLLNFAAVFAGYALTRWGIMQQSPIATWAPLTLALGAILFLGLQSGSQMIWVGDYDAFWQGSATPLHLSLAGWLSAILYAGAAIFLLTLRRLRESPPVQPETVGLNIWVHSTTMWLWLRRVLKSPKRAPRS